MYKTIIGYRYIRMYKLSLVTGIYKCTQLSFATGIYKCTNYQWLQVYVDVATHCVTVTCTHELCNSKMFLTAKHL